MSFNTLIEYLNIPLEMYEANDQYYFGYEKVYYFNGVKIWLNFKKNRCLIDCSGKGCRTLETFDLTSWEEFFCLFIDIGAKFNRVDFAMDVKDTLEYKTCVNAIQKNKYISKVQHLIYIEGSEQTIYVGSPKAKKRLRIYNKALERGVVGNWVRFEFQIRNEGILTFLEYFNQGMSFVNIYSGMLINFIRFTTKPYDGIHPDRFKTSPWYADILTSLEKLKDVKIAKLEYNLESLDTYLSVQVASSLKTMIIANDGDTSRIMEIAGKAKLNTRQKAFLDSHGYAHSDDMDFMPKQHDLDSIINEFEQQLERMKKERQRLMEQQGIEENNRLKRLCALKMQEPQEQNVSQNSALDNLMSFAAEET